MGGLRPLGPSKLPGFAWGLRLIWNTRKKNPQLMGIVSSGWGLTPRLNHITAPISWICLRWFFADCTMGFIIIKRTTIWENIFGALFPNMKEANPRVSIAWTTSRYLIVKLYIYIYIHIWAEHWHILAPFCNDYPYDFLLTNSRTWNAATWRDLLRCQPLCLPNFPRTSSSKVGKPQEQWTKNTYILPLLFPIGSMGLVYLPTWKP